MALVIATGAFGSGAASEVSLIYTEFLQTHTHPLCFQCANDWKENSLRVGWGCDPHPYLVCVSSSMTI
ncbi:hypothetical protein [Chlorogloeopsis sp. ULAP02]|uniref:hypothetical protein n=1 Tax=Chlorogloeopsis sp. ULAP02 TaxID=3107926 RepID=UPI0031353E53